MTKVNVQRDVTDLTSAELLDVYDDPSKSDAKLAVRTEIIRRLSPKEKTAPAPAFPGMPRAKKGA